MAKPPDFEQWTTHGWGMEVSTPQELFGVISSIALLQTTRTYAWRGQNDSSWALSSSLYRRLEDDGGTVTEGRMRKAEQEILKEARRWGLGRDLGASATDMHLLAVLQHHGVPTRLIDVTSNPMTALWFATEEHKPNKYGEVRRSPGVLFAIDVTNTGWRETFDHSTEGRAKDAGDPLAATYEEMLEHSRESKLPFRVFPALPDERMKAQEGFFLGSTVPRSHRAPGVLGFNPVGKAPEDRRLTKLRQPERTPGRPQSLPFVAIVIPSVVKEKIRQPLKRTYNRRRRVLFPDIDGFRDGFLRDQLD